MGIPGVRVRWEDSDLWRVIFLNTFIPFFSILVAVWEHKRHSLAWLLGNPRRAVVAFSVFLILLTIQANLSYNTVVRTQPHWVTLQDNRVLWAGYSLLLAGTLLIYKALRALGFYATFYGAYFGVRVQSEVREFPYTLLAHPMYVGAVLDLLGLAMVFASQAGLVVTVVTAIAYTILARYESVCLLEESEPVDHHQKTS